MSLIIQLVSQFLKAKILERVIVNHTEFLPISTILYDMHLTKTVLTVSSEKLNIVLVYFHIYFFMFQVCNVSSTFSHAYFEEPL